MRASHRDQPAKERVCRLVLNEVVGQDSRRLIVTDAGAAALSQVSYEVAQRRSFPDEFAVACPGDEIDMNVDLNDAGHRKSGVPRIHSRYRAETTSAEKRKETASKTVPRWHQYCERG